MGRSNETIVKSDVHHLKKKHIRRTFDIVGVMNFVSKNNSDSITPEHRMEKKISKYYSVEVLHPAKLHLFSIVSLLINVCSMNKLNICMQYLKNEMKHYSGLVSNKFSEMIIELFIFLY